MLKTRLWMGALLIGLGGLLFLEERWTAPYFPFLSAVTIAAAFAASAEFRGLIHADRRPRPVVCTAGIAAVILANSWPAFGDPQLAWQAVAISFAAALLLVFVVEMRHFHGASFDATERIALSFLVIGYLGFLPSFLLQIRHLPGDGVPSRAAWSLCLLVAVVKGNDIGAYFTGKTIGRHRMTPLLSPKKTWEGAAGGMLASVLFAILVVKSGNLLGGSLLLAVGFGLTVGAAGVLGDLAESLLKRDSGTKDASSAVPGFGGVLDVIDSLLLAGPVAYLWLK